MANSGGEALPAHKTAQLLAAAVQYEKEGRPDLAARYYRQVLAMEPNNVQAAEGLELVQSGQMRTQASYQDIVSTIHPRARPRLQARTELPGEKPEIDEKTAQIIANAAATATAQAIANAVAKATAKYMEENPTAVKDAIPAPTPTPAESVAASEGVQPQPTAAPASQPAVATSPAPAAPLKVDVQVATLEMSTREQAVQRAAAITHELSVKSAEERQTNTSEIVRTAAVTTITEPSPTLDLKSPAETTRIEPQSLTRLCIGANAAVLLQVAKLDSEHASIRTDGLRALAKMGPAASSATIAVKMLFHDDVPLVRAHAAWAAWELMHDAAPVIDPLTKLLTCSDPEAVEFAAYTLAGMGEQARPALPALQTLLTHHNRRVRLHAAETIARIAPPADREAAIDFLVLMTAEPSAEIRTLALLALGSVVKEPTPALTTALTSALHDDDAEVRSAAALMLGGFGPKAEPVVAQLEFVIAGDRQDVKQAAATALDCIRREK